MKAAVIGSPIAHSLSPFIFEFIANEEGREIDYQKTEVDLGQSKSFFNKIKSEKNFVGLNVTLPLKEAFLEDLQFSSPEVLALGALNVLHFKDGEVRGFNTDIIGIQKTLENQNFLVDGKKCIILGAGGSARASAFVLGALKAAEVVIFSRSNKCDDFLLKFKNLFPLTRWMTVYSFDDQVVKSSSFDLIINSTPLGMTGKESGAEFFKCLSQIKFDRGALAFDLIYTPEHTDFLRAAGKLGLRSVGGLGMLIDQGLATWKIWIGELKNEKELHQKLFHFLNGILKLRRDPHPVFLTGFMGVGKSSVGFELSQISGRTFFDTDKEIEKSSLLLIPEIFKIKGESFFRNLEHSIVLNLSESENSVVSLGGGALMNEKTLDAVIDRGVLVYLSADESVLAQRVSKEKDERPLLANLTEAEKVLKIKNLLNLRLDTYQKAKIHIQTDHLNPRQVAFSILSAIGKIEEKGSNP